MQKQLTEVIAQLVEQMTSMAASIAHADGARMAHRHMIARLLTDLPAPYIERTLRDLRQVVEESEGALGAHRTSSYLQELDAIEAQSLRSRGNQGLN